MSWLISHAAAQTDGYYMPKEGEEVRDADWDVIPDENAKITTDQEIWEQHQVRFCSL